MEILIFQNLKSNELDNATLETNCAMTFYYNFRHAARKTQIYTYGKHVMPEYFMKNFKLKPNTITTKLQ